jgi:translation initiation factor IF-3
MKINKTFLIFRCIKNMRKEKNFYRINDKILSKEIRVTGDDIESRIISTDEALKIAIDKKMDLVEIVPNANPPVCKIIDFKKYLYEKKRKEKEQQKLQRKNIIKTKEIRLTYNIGDHDFDFKLKHANEFLKKGNNVKVHIWFSGREIQFIDQGKIILYDFIDKLMDNGKLDNIPKLINNRLIATVYSKNKA